MFTDDELITALATISTRDDAGRHFTQACPCWQELEERGWIAVDRPIHEATGLAYSQEYWSLEITPDGLAVVEAM